MTDFLKPVNCKACDLQEIRQITGNTLSSTDQGFKHTSG